MKMKRFSALTIGLLALSLILAGVTVAALVQVVPTQDTSGAAGKIALLQTTATLTPGQAADRGKLIAVVSEGEVPANSLAAHAELTAAHPIAISGSTATAWVAPTTNGGICTYIPAWDGGFGASCATLAEVTNGDAVSTVDAGPAEDGAVILVALRADGAPPVRVVGADGTTTTVPVRSNVAAAEVKSQGSLTVDGLRLDSPAASPGSCDAPKAGASFVRCR